MRRILKIAHAEYVETVRTKTFLLSALIVPVFVLAVVFFETSRARSRAASPPPVKKVAVTDLTGNVYEELRQAFDRYNASGPSQGVTLVRCDAGEPDPEASVAALRRDVEHGTLDACVVLAQGIIEGTGESPYYTKDTSDWRLFNAVKAQVDKAVFNVRLRMHDLSPELISDLGKGVSLASVAVSPTPAQSGDQKAITMIVAFAFVFLMYMGVVGTGQRLVVSLIEEKSSRVIEVLLAAVSPYELMAGKILGLAAVSFTLIGLYAGAGFWLASARGFHFALGAGIAVYFVVYYVLGFLMIATLMAALGSTCNTIRDTQSLMMPIMLLMIVPLMTWTHIVQQPEGTLATVLSFIPPITPMVMMLRIAASPAVPWYQIAASIALLAVCVPLTIAAAAKVFRVGILMYGKRPSLKELLRWVRYK